MFGTPAVDLISDCLFTVPREVPGDIQHPPADAASLQLNITEEAVDPPPCGRLAEPEHVRDVLLKAPVWDLREEGQESVVQWRSYGDTSFCRVYCRNGEDDALLSLYLNKQGWDVWLHFEKSPAATILCWLGFLHRLLKEEASRVRRPEPERWRLML